MFIVSRARTSAACLVLVTTSLQAASPQSINVETLALEEVIVTGTKFNGDFGEKSGIPIEKVPQSVQVISSEDIATLGARSVGDLLRTVPSADPGFSRVGAYQSFSLKLRGFLADQMRNGIRQRYYEDVDASALSNIERVEVLKGPSGVLYGESAVGGIISIITKRPQQTFASSASATLGNDRQKVISADVTGGVAPGLALRLTGELERSGTFVDHQDLDRDNAGFALRYAPTNNVTANLVAEYVERRTRRYPGLPIKGTVESNGSAELSRGLNLGEPAVDALKANAPLVQVWVDAKLSDTWALTPRLQYQEFNSEFIQIRVRAPQSNLTTIDRTGRAGKEDDAYQIGQLDLAGTLQLGQLTHKLLLGYEHNRERGRFTQYNLGNVTPISVLNPVYNYDSVAPISNFAFDRHYNLDGDAVYAQDLLALTDRWDVVGAVRHSQITAWTANVGGPEIDRTQVQATIWQLGTTYRISGGLSVYAGYNTGFDVESSAGTRAANGEPLQPEDSTQLELGLRVKRERFNGSAALFQIKRINALTTDPTNPDFSLNTGEQRVRGLELEGEWALQPHWSLRAGYAYLDSEVTRSNDGDQGKRIGDVPEHSLNARTEFQVPGTTLTLRGGVNHVSNRLLVNGSAVRLPAYTLADISAGLRVGACAMDIFLANLFDEHYYTASGNAFAVIPGDPRNVGVRISRHW